MITSPLFTGLISLPPYLGTRDFNFDVSLNNVAAFSKFLGKELSASVATKHAGMAKPRIIVRSWEE